MTPQTIPDELTHVYLNGVKDGLRKRAWIGLNEPAITSIMRDQITCRATIAAVAAKLKELNA
jgi:hypothetical protein